MQRVLKNIFLLDDKIENNLKFWVILGPFLLLLSISLANLELSIFTAVSFFLCYRFKFKGLILALITLVVYSFYQQVNLEEKHLWNLGLQLSIALGLIISTFGFDEIKNYLSLHESNKNQDFLYMQNQLNENQSRFEATKKNLEENLILLKGELNKKTQKIQQIVLENEKLKKDLQDNIYRKDYLLNELDQKVKEIENLYVKQDELFKKSSFLKDEELLQEKNKTVQKEIEELKKSNQNHQQEREKVLNELEEKNKKINELLSQLSQTKNIEKYESKIKEKEKEILNLKEKLKTASDIKNINITDSELMKEYKNKMKEFNHVSSLYLQLKKQFEEKQDVLHKTRQELFHVKEKLTAYQREKNNDFEDLNEYERIMLFELDKTIEDLQEYKTENEDLEKIVSVLLQI